MDASSCATTAEPSRRFYLRSLVYVVPALTVWAFASDRLYPKVQVIWREGGAVGSEAQWLMDAVGGLVAYGWVAVATVAMAAVLGELRSARWARRRLVVESAVVVLNAAVLLGLAAQCLLAVYAAPGLTKHAEPGAAAARGRL